MKLFIPELGTKLRLTKTHHISIQIEDRNESMFEKFYFDAFAKYKVARIHAGKLYWKHEPGILRYQGNTPAYKEAAAAADALKSKVPTKFKLEKGTILEVDRIYIRQGGAKYSSVTFKIREKKVLRFWLSLAVVNTLHCEVVGEPAESRKKPIQRCSIGG